MLPNDYLDYLGEIKYNAQLYFAEGVLSIHENGLIVKRGKALAYYHSLTVEGMGVFDNIARNLFTNRTASAESGIPRVVSEEGVIAQATACWELKWAIIYPLSDDRLDCSRVPRTHIRWVQNLPTSLNRLWSATVKDLCRGGKQRQRIELRVGIEV